MNINVNQHVCKLLGDQYKLDKIHELVLFNIFRKVCSEYYDRYQLPQLILTTIVHFCTFDLDKVLATDYPSKDLEVNFNDDNSIANSFDKMKKYGLFIDVPSLFPKMQGRDWLDPYSNCDGIMKIDNTQLQFEFDTFTFEKTALTIAMADIDTCDKNYPILGYFSEKKYGVNGLKQIVSKWQNLLWKKQECCDLMKHEGIEFNINENSDFSCFMIQFSRMTKKLIELISKEFKQQGKCNIFIQFDNDRTDTQILFSFTNSTINGTIDDMIIKQLGFDQALMRQINMYQLCVHTNSKTTDKNSKNSKNSALFNRIDRFDCHLTLIFEFEANITFTLKTNEILIELFLTVSDEHAIKMLQQLCQKIAFFNKENQNMKDCIVRDTDGQLVLNCAHFATKKSFSMTQNSLQFVLKIIDNLWRNHGGIRLKIWCRLDRIPLSINYFK